MENFKSMYPRGIRVIQSYVSEACDRMDYQNSPMYDEWPEQRMVDQMCNSVCEAVSASGDIGILRDAWEMQEKKTIKRMSVEEEQEEEVGEQEKEGMEKGTDREKEKVETEELNDEENKKNDGEKKTVDERREEDIKEGAEENKNSMESDMGENIYQVTAEADLREHNRITESQEMRPPLRRWWNGWGINGIGPDVQGMAWGMGPMYAPVVPVETENGTELLGQELRRPPHIPVPAWPPYPPQNPGPVRPPRPPQGPGPVRPPYPPQGPGPVRPPYPPQGPGPVRPPRPPQGPGPVRPPRPPQGPGPVRPPYPPQNPGPVRPPRPPQGPGPVRPPRPGIYPAWFRDIVKTLILDEMQNRRCRRGMCIG